MTVSRTMLALPACLVTLVLSPRALSQQVRWINAQGGDFSNGTNWDLGRPPTLEEAVIFDLPATYAVTIPGGTRAGRMLMTHGDVTFEVLGTQDFTGFGVVTGDSNLIGAPGTNARLTVASGKLNLYGDRPALVVASGATLRATGTGSVGDGNAASTFIFGPGSTLIVDGGRIVPRYTFYDGATVRVTNGGRIEPSNGEGGPNPSDILITGAGSRIWPMEVASLCTGRLEVRDGGTVGGNRIGLAGCEVIVGPGGYFSSWGGVDGDLGSTVVVRAGGHMEVAGPTVYRGPVTVEAGATVPRLAARFEGPLHIDGANASHYWAEAMELVHPLNVDIDAAYERTAPVLLAGVGGGSSLGVALVLSVRNHDSITPGQRVLMAQHHSSDLPAFTSVIAAPLPAGIRPVLVRTAITYQGWPTMQVSVEFEAAPCYSDFNRDGDHGTDQDIEAFFACIAGSCCPECGSQDYNGDGDFGTDQDIEAFFRVLAGGGC